MTVASIYQPPQYTGNGASTAFAFSYPFFTPSELVVNLFDTIAAVDVAPQPVRGGGATYDYVVSGVQDPDTGEYLSGATVTFNTAPPSNYVVTIFRNVQPTQNVALTNNARFPAKTVEGSLDRITMVVQQLMDLTAALLLSSPGSLAGKLLGFDANGNLTSVPALAVMTPTGDHSFVIGDGQTAIAAGFYGDLGPFDYDMVIGGYTLLPDQSGTISIDLWVDTYANFPPTLADSIVGANPMLLSAAAKAQDFVLTGWAKVIPAGRTIRVQVNASPAPVSVKQVTATLKYTTTALTADAASQSFETMFDALQAEFDTIKTTASLGTSGYQTLPSGLILQWGIYNSSGTSNPTINFPIAFTSACYGVKCMPLGTGADTDDVINNNAVRSVNLDAGTPPTTTQFKVFTSAEHGVEDVFHAHTSTSFYWFAIGK